MRKRVVSLIYNTPYEVVGAKIREKPIVSTQEMIHHIWSLGKVGIGEVKHGMFPLVFPHGGTEITDLSSVFLVQARIGHVHDVLRCLVVSEDTTRLSYKQLLTAGKRHAFDHENG